MADDLQTEYNRRIACWKELSDGSVATDLAPAALRARGIYRGAAGIWVDKSRTSEISGDKNGITVSVLHNGYSYADDLSEDCLIYHYPETERPGVTDSSEVEATKNAHKLGLPIFVITHPYRKAKTRDLNLGWVEDWDDSSKVFLINFGETPPQERKQVSNDSPFKLTTTRKKETTTSESTARPGQQRFKFECLKRYGQKCAVCSMTFEELLDAAHLRSVSANGSDDPRNGLILCSLHHRALDNKLYGIDPKSLEICLAPGVSSGAALNLERVDITHLSNPPHVQALAWLWKRFAKKHKLPG
jgi:hypothetical protein